MRSLVFGFALVALTACGDSSGPPPVDDPVVLPFPQFEGDGLLRFTLDQSCPAMAVEFGVDISWYGPEIMDPGESKDYQVPAGTYSTRGRDVNSTRTFPTESRTVVAQERVTRVLSC